MTTFRGIAARLTNRQRAFASEPTARAPRWSGRFARCSVALLVALACAGCGDDRDPGDAHDPDAQDTRDDVADIFSDVTDVRDAGHDASDSDEVDTVDTVDVPCQPLAVDDEGFADIEFQVDADSTGFLWTLFARGQRPEIESVVPPAGLALPTDRIAKLFDSQDILSGDSVSILLTSFDLDAVPGTWGARVRLRTPADEPTACETLIQRAPVTESDALIPRQLSARFVLVADPTRFSTRIEEDVSLQRLAASAGTAIGTLGVEFRSSGWTIAPQTDREQFSVLFDESDLDALARTSPDYLRDTLGKEVIVFLVEGFADGFGGSGGITVGRTGSIPGSPANRPSDAGAVVISTDGVEQPMSAEYLGKVLGHELGHYLGLTHTTEQSGDAHDTLADTPECGSTIRQNYTLCADGNNLMFPIVRPNREAESSDSQRSLVQNHPFVKGP